MWKGTKSIKRTLRATTGGIGGLLTTEKAVCQKKGRKSEGPAGLFTISQTDQQGCPYCEGGAGETPLRTGLGSCVPCA